MSRARGCSLVELVVVLGLGLAITAGTMGAVATALRHLTRVALRTGVDDLAHLALETFTLDVRRAGYDPRAAGIEALAEATPTRLTLRADLDADGGIDATSEEHTTLACDLPGGRLSRILGSQSLPLANGVTACAFTYADGDAIVLASPPGGLDAASRRRVRQATLTFALIPAVGQAPATTRASVAIRVLP